MRLICTYCSADKRRAEEPLPAVQRYRSQRITSLHAAALKQKLPFRILSGRHGLVTPEQPLPWYDHLLQSDEVAGLVPQVANALTAGNFTCLEYHSADPAFVPQLTPYLDLIQRACALADVSLELLLLPGDPA